ncbi:MAG: VCBS repeat-containing protein [Planctomycetes bacterium]|nr:VCBS repeat-containing protein [Planctomycetota bacterium]MBI3844875.1 VCBS repeat-containing protein [Planctomycetota bacterium]
MILSALVAMGVALGAPTFRTFELPAEGDVSATFTEDLDGDGLREVGLVVGRRLRLWFPKSGDAGIALGSPQTLDLPGDVALFDLADVVGDAKRKQIVLLTPTGISYLEAKDGRLATELHPLLARRSAIDFAPDRKPLPLHFAQDFDGDGAVDLLVPEATGYGLFTRGADGKGARFSREQHLHVKVGAKLTIGGDNFLGRARSVSGFPKFYTGNFDGDGKPDLLVYRSGKLLYFRQGEGGAFPELPTSEFTVDLPKTDGRREVPDRNPVTAMDVDHDGIQDLVVTETRTGITRIYLGGAEFTGVTKPVQIIKVKDWSIGTILEDLNGDGLLDLVVPTTQEIGLFEALRILITKEFKVTSYVFRNRGKELFSKQPDSVRTIRFPIRLSSDTAGERSISVYAKLILSFDGDLDGDGIRDLAIGDGPKSIAVYYGTKEAVFPETPSCVLPIPDTGPARVVEASAADVNGDGVSDLLLLYRSTDKQSDRLVLLLSAK